MSEANREGWPTINSYRAKLASPRGVDVWEHEAHSMKLNQGVCEFQSHVGLCETKVAKEIEKDAAEIAVTAKRKALFPSNRIFIFWSAETGKSNKSMIVDFRASPILYEAKDIGSRSDTVHKNCKVHSMIRPATDTQDRRWPTRDFDLRDKLCRDIMHMCKPNSTPSTRRSTRRNTLVPLWRAYR